MWHDKQRWCDHYWITHSITMKLMAIKIPPTPLSSPRGCFHSSGYFSLQQGQKIAIIIIMSSLSFRMATATSAIRVLPDFPACVPTHTSHSPHTLQAPGRSVYLPLQWLLINTWIKTRKGLLRLGRQQTAADLQFKPLTISSPTPSSSFTFCNLWLELSPAWLRMHVWKVQ